MHIVIVTGLSGAGRSKALDVLEDLGFFRVDNLPPPLGPNLVELLRADGISKLALGIDVRTRTFLDDGESFIDELHQSEDELEVIFMECADDTLVRRFSETRRPHPMAPEGGAVLDGIKLERARLAPFRARTDQVIDTTDLSVHDLRHLLVDHASRRGDGRGMVARVVSFGFKYGIAVDADIVFDLRYLPNPYFIPALRPKSGLQDDVAEYVLGQPAAKEFLDDVVPMLTRMLPRFEREGKSYLTIAIGCTGGRHRSVAISEAIGERLRETREVRVSHRDVHRKKPQNEQ